MIETRIVKFVSEYVVEYRWVGSWIIGLVKSEPLLWTRCYPTAASLDAARVVRDEFVSNVTRYTPAGTVVGIVVE